MERIPYRKYNKEFREEVVRLILESGVSVLAAVRQLSLAGHQHYTETLYESGKIYSFKK